MPVKDYRAWYQTPAGMACRERNKAKYIEKRRAEGKIVEPQPDTKAVQHLINNWARHDSRH